MHFLSCKRVVELYHKYLDLREKKVCLKKLYFYVTPNGQYIWNSVPKDVKKICDVQKHKKRTFSSFVTIGSGVQGKKVWGPDGGETGKSNNFDDK